MQVEAELRPRYQRLIRSSSPGWESGHGAFKNDQAVETHFFFFFPSERVMSSLSAQSPVYLPARTPQRDGGLRQFTYPPAAVEHDRGGCDAREPAWIHHGTIASGCEALNPDTNSRRIL